MSVSEHLDPERMYALLDKRLGEGHARAAEAHIWRCATCRALREECDATLRSLAWYAAHPPAPPAGYWRAFWAGLPAAGTAAASRPAAGGAGRRQFALAAVVATILIGGAALWMQPGPTREAAPPVRPPIVVQSEWMDDYRFFERMTMSIGSVDPVSKGVVLASFAERP